MSDDGKSIVIVGAGITGLATAIGLSRLGHVCRILEARESLEEVGPRLQAQEGAS